MNKAEYYKNTYPVGPRIRLLHMDDPYSPVPDAQQEQLHLLTTWEHCT